MTVAVRRSGVRQRVTSSVRQRGSLGTNTPAGTYYVSLDGSDANNGLTPDTPFASVDPLSALDAGSVILFERGGIWTDELLLTANALRVGAYGLGALPRIDRGTEPTGGLFDDGFESETNAFDVNWNGKTEASSTVTVESAAPLRGAKSLKYTHASNGTAYVTKTLASQSDIYVQIKVKIETLITGSNFGSMRILRLNPMFGWLYLQHDATPDRGVQVRFQGGESVNVTDPTYYQQGQELRIELHARAGIGNAGVECWVNGILLAGGDFTGTNTNAATSFTIGNDLNNANGLGAGSVLMFDDVKVSAARPIGVGTRGADGIEFQGDDCIAEDIEVCNTDEFLVKFRDCSRGKLRRVQLHDCNRTGVLASIGGGDHTIENSEIRFCGSSGKDGGECNGIHFLSTTTGSNVVRNTYIHHTGVLTGDHGIYSQGGVLLSTQNRYRFISGFGVKTKEGSQGSMILRDRMEFCRTGAVNVDRLNVGNSEPVNVYHNSAYNCGRFPSGLSPYAAFWVSGYAKMRLRNNIAYDPGNGIKVDTNAELVESDNNVIYSANAFGVLGATSHATLAAWRTSSGQDANSVDTDPLFTNPDAGDLSLQAGSPAVDLGAIIPGVDDGFTGTAPDAGYLEGS